VVGRKKFPKKQTQGPPTRAAPGVETCESSVLLFAADRHVCFSTLRYPHQEAVLARDVNF
jgi:hypothetical protein